MNPINFFFLSKEISDHWIELRKILAKSKISASLPIFNWTSGRAILPNNFGERNKVRNNFLKRRHPTRVAMSRAAAASLDGLRSIARRSD
jgi:hypothetical protein